MPLCASDRPRKKPSKTVAFLLSCCLCLLVICACLVATLVFVGRHILYNQPPRYAVANVPPVTLDKLLVASPRYQRLPKDTRPLVYDLTLLPDLQTGKFEGWVDVTINVTGFRKDLVIHSKNLTINEIKLTRRDSKELRVLSVNEIHEDEVLIITTREKILPDVYYLFIGFEGSLKDRLTGFYRSEYRRRRSKEQAR